MKSLHLHPLGRLDLRGPIRLSAGLIVVALLHSGCRMMSLESDPPRSVVSDKTDNPGSPATAPDPSGENDSTKATARAEKAAETEDKKRGTIPEDGDLEDDRWVDGKPFDGWYRASARADLSLEEGEYRWRNNRLEALLDRPGEAWAELRRLVESANPVARATAAIGLARLGGDRYNRALAEIVRTPSEGTLAGGPGLSLSQRRAAAETLARVTDPSPRVLLVQLCDEFGRFNHAQRDRYKPQLHAELLRGLARHVAPQDNDHFVSALKSPSAKVLRQTLDLWRDHGDGLPREVVTLSDHPNPPVRAAALEALAAHGHPQALDSLRLAVHDVDLGVRRTAIEGLGRLGGEPAGELLKDLLANQPVWYRKAAVAALATLGEMPAVYTAAEDKSWHVRRAVAMALANDSSEHAAVVVGKLLEDSSPEVRLRAVEAAADRPWPSAGPLLLSAAALRDHRVSKMAMSTLAERWPPARDFPAKATAQRRAEALQRLKQQWTDEHGHPEEIAKRQNDQTGPPAGDEVITQERVDGVRTLIEQHSAAGSEEDRRRIEARLIGVGSLLPAILQRHLAAGGRPLVEAIYRNILPRIDPVFQTVERLRSETLLERRRAAQQLARNAPSTQWPALAVDRIAALTATEPDALVWQSVLQATADDGGPAAERLAYAATAHPTAEVRRRACRYLEEHAAARHVAVLLPMLDDPNSTTVKAAVRALGHVGTLDDVGPLKRLLVSSDKLLRVEAAVALARLGSASGTAALERFSYDKSEDIRRLVAGSMGSLADSAYLPALIRLLDDRLAVHRAAHDALIRVVGRDVTAEGEPATGDAEKIGRWKQWYLRQGTATRGAAKAPSKPVRTVVRPEP